MFIIYGALVLAIVVIGIVLSMARWTGPGRQPGATSGTPGARPTDRAQP